MIRDFNRITGVDDHLSTIAPDDFGERVEVTQNAASDYYRDLYAHEGWPYSPLVVWQFWGRAAEGVLKR